MDRNVIIRPGDRAIIRVEGVGVVYVAEAVAEVDGLVATILTDEINDEVLDANTFEPDLEEVLDAAREQLGLHGDSLSEADYAAAVKQINDLEDRVRA